MAMAQKNGKAKAASKADSDGPQGASTARSARSRRMRRRGPAVSRTSEPTPSRPRVSSPRRVACRHRRTDRDRAAPQWPGRDPSAYTREPQHARRPRGAGGPGSPDSNTDGGSRHGRQRQVARAPAAAAPTRTGGPRPEPSLRILETRVLRGPNYWAREPVIRQVVDLGVLEEFPSNKIPGFVDALVEHAADARGPRLLASAGAAGSSRGSARAPGSGHVAEHIALEFQNLAGTDVRHGKTRGTGEYGRYNVIFEYREEQVGIEAGKDGRRARQPPRRARATRAVRLRPHGRAREAHPARGAAGVRARRRRRCSTRPPAATSRTSGSTGSASSSSARASTSSASARR